MHKVQSVSPFPFVVKMGDKIVRLLHVIEFFFKTARPILRSVLIG